MVAGGLGSGKSAVIGAVSRKGNVVLRVIDRTDTATLDAFVLCHEDGQHVIGAVHTNTIEGFWSILKRGVIGTYHTMSRKYLPLYVAEFQFRHNNRGNPDIFGAAIARC